MNIFQNTLFLIYRLPDILNIDILFCFVRLFPTHVEATEVSYTAQGSLYEQLEKGISLKQLFISLCHKSHEMLLFSINYDKTSLMIIWNHIFEKCCEGTKVLECLSEENIHQMLGNF